MIAMRRGGVASSAGGDDEGGDAGWVRNGADIFDDVETRNGLDRKERKKNRAETGLEIGDPFYTLTKLVSKI